MLNCVIVVEGSSAVSRTRLSFLSQMPLREEFICRIFFMERATTVDDMPRKKPGVGTEIRDQMVGQCKGKRW